MHMRKPRKTSGAPRVSVKQMTFGPFVVPLDTRSGQFTGHIAGTLGSYQWTFIFHYEPDPFDAEMWLWDYNFIVKLDKVKIYSNASSFVNVDKALFGEDYVRQVCEQLAQEFIDEGPAV